MPLGAALEGPVAQPLLDVPRQRRIGHRHLDDVWLGLHHRRHMSYRMRRVLLGAVCSASTAGAAAGCAVTAGRPMQRHAESDGDEPHGHVRDATGRMHVRLHFCKRGGVRRISRGPLRLVCELSLPILVGLFKRAIHDDG